MSQLNLSALCSTRCRPVVPSLGLNQRRNNSGCVIYWMSREHRVFDNHALSIAQSIAIADNLPLLVMFNLLPKFLDATERHFRFMFGGLREVEAELKQLQIGFEVVTGFPPVSVPAAVVSRNAAIVVTDFSPLRISVDWRTKVGQALATEGIPVLTVDAHNIVPLWVTSEKLEYAARTIRPKIHRHLTTYLEDIATVEPHPYPYILDIPEPDWKLLDDSLEIDRSVKEVSGILPGTKAAKATLKSFCEQRLKIFDTHRNDPNSTALSGMAPYFHFGQFSPQRAVLEVSKFKKQYPKAVEAFVEETVVRRELSDNFCFYNPHYDSFKGASDWARISLDAHRNDKREYVYNRQQFENGSTHDQLWNAAQLQMVNEGKMHGFMRMYWAKKILEWSESPESALATAIYLNDRYSLDGRDPNGYVGCMWSVCGIHDQGWAERLVFGKIRFMNEAGCRRKFDVPAYIKKHVMATRGGALKQTFENNKKRKQSSTEEHSTATTAGSSGSSDATAGSSGSSDATASSLETSSMSSAKRFKSESADL